MIVRLSSALLLLAVLTSSCVRGPLAWQRFTLNEPIAEHDVTFIVDGVTPLSEVVARLGTPDEMQSVGQLIVARYHFSDGRYFRADYGWGLRFVIPYSSPDLVMGGGGFGTDIFQVTCDARWVVQEHAFAWHTNSSEFRLWPFGERSNAPATAGELPVSRHPGIMPRHVRCC
jgi:hypothetical protein